MHELNRRPNRRADGRPNRRVGVRLTVGVVVAALVGILVLSTASPGGAAVAQKNSKFCKQVTKFGRINASGSSVADDLKVAAADAKALKKAAKSAPGKVKSALNDMASFFAAVGSAGSKLDAEKAAIAHASQYTKAVSTFISYYTKNCVTIPSIPTT
jgi:hypothetical protein